MTLTLEVDATTTIGLSASLKTIKAAIQDAWADTRAQMEDYQFGESTMHTAFGQFLVHNVRNRVSGIDIHGVMSNLVPNRRHTANHERVIVEGALILTFSAVESQKSSPRPAQFRTEYAEGLQSWFDITDQNEFEAMRPPKATLEYIQILHGSKGSSDQERRELGFINVAFPSSGGGYRRRSIPLDAYIAELSIEQPVGIEVVEEEENLGVTLKKETPYADK